MHAVNAGWAFDGNYDAPTFSPSVMVTSGHFVSEFKAGDACWCTFNAARRERGEGEVSFACSRCHSFVKAGRIEFLADSTHALAGRTSVLFAPP